MFKATQFSKVVVVIIVLLSLVLASAQAVAQEADAATVALGKAIFFDEGLSANGNQSCASCHAPQVGFTGPDSATNAGGAVYEGSMAGRFGNRKPPAASYAGHSPELYYDQSAGEWVGGMFWDGRATGWTLHDPLAEQAKGPFLNPLEQAVPDAAGLVANVAGSGYADLFEQVCGLNAAENPTASYDCIGMAVAAYERSAEVNPYSSKFDLFWDKANKAGKDVTKIKFGTTGDPYSWQAYRRMGLTDTELQGLAAFNDPNRADCASCHSIQPAADGYPLFTDHRYDNIGIPKNPDNPFYAMGTVYNPEGASWVDYGLGGYLKSSGAAPEVYGPELGKFKVPTLRNVDLRPSTGFVKAYGHNGYFKSLGEIVMFYHWRAMNGGMGGGGMGGGGRHGSGMGGMGGMMFPEPEVSQNLATLKMFPGMDRPYIVAFLKTLSDGYSKR